MVVNDDAELFSSQSILFVRIEFISGRRRYSCYPLAWVCRCEVVKYVQTFCSSTYHAHRGGRTIIFRIFYDAEYCRMPNAETRNPKPETDFSLLSALKALSFSL